MGEVVEIVDAVEDKVKDGSEDEAEVEGTMLVTTEVWTICRVAVTVVGGAL